MIVKIPCILGVLEYWSGKVIEGIYLATLQYSEIIRIGKLHYLNHLFIG